MINRRRFLAASGFLLPAVGSPRAALRTALAKLERTNGGRLGVAVVDAGTGARTGYRDAERFPMCSTFKFLLAAALLQRVDRGRSTLADAIRIPSGPLLPNSPVTELHAGGTMTTGGLCEAALTRSDNTAANLLLDVTGGPPSVTAFARSIGDDVTRLDRTEVALNEAAANDPRDTTSPRAMARDLVSVLLGEELSRPSRAQLTRWMEANVTGRDRLRAGLPKDWRAADKTGSNGEHTSNDIAVIWPGAKPPIVVAAYITQCTGPEAKRAAMLADIGRLVKESVS